MSEERQRSQNGMRKGVRTVSFIDGQMNGKEIQQEMRRGIRR